MNTVRATPNGVGSNPRPLLRERAFILETDMSADNFLLTLPAAKGKIAVYDVSASDNKIDLSAPVHEYAFYVHHAYATRLVGEFATVEEMEAEIARYTEVVQVEYPTRYAHA